MGRAAGDGTLTGADNQRSASVPELSSLGRSLAALEQDSTLVAVIDMGQSSWLVAGIVPGVERQP